MSTIIKYKAMYENIVFILYNLNAKTNKNYKTQQNY